jgi:hypothetical protein
MAVLRHPCLEAALCTILAQRFASPEMPAREWRRACEDVLLRPPPGFEPGCNHAAAAKAAAACLKSKQNKKKHGDGGSEGGCSSTSASSSKGPSQSSSCENLALAAVASLKATASMESFALMAALAEARANEWPPVEGDWEVSARCRI